MATIDWANAVSGTWTTGADWAGGIVPGPIDTAVIEAANGRAKYTISVASPVSVGGLVLDSQHATLSVDSTFTVADMALESGTVLLDNGTLAGTVSETGGSLKLGGTTDTLLNVTWQGNFYETSKSTLTISGGLTLTGAGGSGSGTATLGNHVVLDGVSTLDNAAITQDRGTISVLDTSTLTLGSQLSIYGAHLDVGSGVALVNDGVLSNISVKGGIVTNAGTIAGFYELAAKSFTNNGQIDVPQYDQATLNVQGLQQAGATGTINVAGQGALFLEGSLTTAQFNTIFTQQHVIGSIGFTAGIAGTLNNAGTTLDIGTGTRFDNFDSAPGVITGGTVVDHGGNASFFGSLSTLTLQSLTSTLSTGYAVTLDNVTVTGASVLSGDGVVCNGGTLSGVGTISLSDPAQADPYFALNGVDITGIDNSGSVTVMADGLIQGLTITAAQSIVGYDIHLTNYTGLLLEGGAMVDDADVTFSSPGDRVSFFYGDSGDTTNVTLGAAFITAVTSGTDVVIDARNQYVAPVLEATGVFNVAGTLQVGYANTYVDLNNTGAIDVAAGGTLRAQANPDTTFSNGGTIAAAAGVIDIATDITNAGLITDAFGGAATTATIGGAITGAGTIAITGSGTLALGGTVAKAQIVQLGAGAETVDLSKVAASKGFAGTLDGFAKGDAVILSGEAVSSAQFSGSSIVATLSSGGSIVLATGAPLHGALSVSENSGNATLTYSSSESSLRDWSAAEVTRSQAGAAPAQREFGGCAPRDEFLAIDQLPMHHPWHLAGA